MSILIKGMDMPKDCGDCPFCIFTADEKKYIGYCNTSDDDYYCKMLDRFMEYDDVEDGVDIFGKPDDCPLVEVPTPHGRLIDADASTSKFNGVPIIDEHAKLIFKHCDTVIEAEEAESEE